MVDKAQRQQHREEVAAQRDERDEQAIIKNQMQTGRLSSAKTHLQNSLEHEFNPVYDRTFGSRSEGVGARLASRAAGGDIGGTAEERGETPGVDSARSVLTSAAFTSGMSIRQDGIPAEIGQALGTAKRAFGEDEAEGKTDRTATSASAVAEMTLAPEGKRVSVYQYVAAATQLPLERLGAVHTLRQVESMEIIRELTKMYPEFQRLDGLPVSLRDGTRPAVDQIMNAALCHATIHAVIKAEPENNWKQTVESFGTVGRRLIPPREIIEIEPSKAFGDGALAA